MLAAQRKVIGSSSIVIRSASVAENNSLLLLSRVEFIIESPNRVVDLIEIGCCGRNSTSKTVPNIIKNISCFLRI